MAGEATLKEIAEQFDVWAGLIEDIGLLESDVGNMFPVKEYDDVLFVGAGSSYHLATAAAASFRFVSGEMAVAYPASEIIFFHRYLLKKERKYLVVLFSRSGRTPETLQALEELRKNYRVAGVAISCDPLSPLCKMSEVSFPVKACFEESIIMTKSFTSMLFVSYMFAMALGEKFTNTTYLEQFADEGRASFEMQRRVVEQIVAEAPLERITILGGGPFHGLARECALKLDEMAMLRSQALSPLELRHGPRAQIGRHDLIIFFLSNSARAMEIDLLYEVKNLGARTLILSDKKEREFDALADYLILTGRSLPEQYRGILYVPFIQYLGALAALKRGIDPDAPPNLTRIVGL
jgi:glucosamine--fructose-6-phosphate aminotransferase (isomerizing)